MKISATESDIGFEWIFHRTGYDVVNDFRNALYTAIRENICTVLSAINNYNDWFSRLPFGFVNIGDGFIRDFYRALCNREPPPLPDPPFVGGQCPGVLYNVTSQWQTLDDNDAPISGTVVNWNPTGLIGPITFIGPLPSEDVPGRINRSILHNNGDSRVNFGSLDTSGIAKTYQLISANIVRADGLPDLCGDPAPIIPAPDPGYNQPSLDFTYIDYSDNSVNLTGNFIFGAPLIKVDGTLTIPVRIDLGGVNPTFNGNLNLNEPFIEINFGNRNYTPSPSPSPDGYRSPDESPDVPDDVPVPVTPPSPDESEPDTSRVIRGVIVTIINLSESVGVIYQGENPDIYIPNAGYVNFLIGVGQLIAWSIDLPVKNRRCFIPCPWEGGAIAVEGTPRAGIVWELTPVYAIAEDTVTFTPFG